MDIQMTNEKRSLTPEDPVDAETLAQFARLQETKQHLALVLTQLELDKIEILRSVSRIDEQNRRLFETCLVDRGIPPTNDIEIDSKTGRLVRKRSLEEVAEQAQPVPPPEVASEVVEPPVEPSDPKPEG
jgi:hypothetical protein